MMRASIITIFAVWLSVFNSLEAEAKTYKDYVPDLSPLEADANLASEYKGIFNPDRKDTITREQLKRAYDIMSILVRKNPKLIDGYWLLGSVAFQWGGSFTEEKDLPFARSIFAKGQEATEKCLGIEPKQFLCKLFLGSAIGSIGTIDGILSSLIKAKRVESLWNEVILSEYNYTFFGTTSAQSSVRYGLGMFYRLVPDLIIMKWLFDVRGSLATSIKMHREGRDIAGEDVCSTVMLGVSLLCFAKEDESTPEGAEGFQTLKRAVAAEGDPNMMMQICAQDAQKILAKPALACGYTTSKQQDLSEESVKKSSLH